MEKPGASDAAQATRLMSQAREGGLRFEAYLPPELAVWLLGLIEQGAFTSPSEAAFVMLGEQHELEPHHDLRQELLSRSLQAAIDDPRPPIPADIAFERLRQRSARSLPEPAKWEREGT